MEETKFIFEFMDELLQYAVKNGMIDLSYIQEQITMEKRKELLEKHPYKIWQGKDGKFYTYLPNKEKGRVLKKKKSLKEIEDDVIRYWKEESDNPTIEEVFNEWNDRRLELGKISNATHLRNTQIFERHFSKKRNEKIKNISEDEFFEYIEQQIPEHNLTEKAFSNLRTVSKGFLKRAKKRKLIDFNVEQMFQEMDVSERDFKKTIREDYQEVFTESETPKIINYLKENPDQENICILLMFVTGIRLGEATTLKHEDFMENFFKIRRTETTYKDENGNYVCEVKDFPKTLSGVRTVVVPENYIWILKRIRQQNPFGDYVFFKNGHRIRNKTIRKRLYTICRKLSIYSKSPNKIRKTYASILLDNSIDNRLIISQMGHADISCTENHYHRNRRSIGEKAAIISSIPEFCAK